MFTPAESHQYLRQYAIKPSVQRTAVMTYLMNNRIHPTIDEIFLALSPSMPTLSRTTVYNTLDIFVERGAVRALLIDEKNARYDVDITAHAHFKCKSCGIVCDLFNLSPVLFQLPQHSDFEIESVDVSYTGTCDTCKGN